MLGRLLVAVVCLIQLARAGESGGVVFLDRRIPLFEAHNEPMLEAVAQLRKSGARVCFEEVELDPVTDRVPDPRTGQIQIRKKTFSVRMKNASVKEILDAIVQSDGEYVWQADSQDQLIEILPGARTSNGVVVRSVLDWQVSLAQGLSGKRLDIIRRQLDLEQHTVYFFWRGPYEVLNPPVTLRAQSSPIRSILNQLVSAEPRMCWTLAGFKGGRIFSCVPC